MSPLPAEFLGLWERVELVVEGRVITDAGRSFWFQARNRFLDVRAAGGGLQSEAFAGVTSWDEDQATLHWTHDLDLHGNRPSDVDRTDDAGRVAWRDGDLVEHGTAVLGDETIDYTETWRRLSRRDDAVVIADRLRGRGRLALCGAQGGVLIDDRPNGPLQAGKFVDHRWARTFDLVLGMPLAIERSRLRSGGGEQFHAYGATWLIVEST